MSLCFKLKLMWKEITSTSLRQRGSTQCTLGKNQVTTDGSESTERVNVQEELDSNINGQVVCYEAHGITFTRREDRDSFLSKMKEMREAFEKEILEISHQHQRLRAGGYLLHSRVLEMERIIKTDQRKKSVDSIRTLNCDSSLTNTKDFRVVQEMDTLYNMLDNTHEEIISLKKYLGIEYKERTLYPEPAMLRSAVVEDEYSRKMKQDGGLLYQSKDNTMKHITYQCLPPPFSLRQITAH